MPTLRLLEVMLAHVQKQFDEFNDAIILKRFEENATLREKRDIIRDKLDEWLPAVFEYHEEECPDFDFRDQGSYEMGTGIKPLEGDYDIDQGLYFQVRMKDYPDPVVLKQRVHEALDGHTDDVCIRRSCVTVFYHRQGERIYHVDITVYSDSPENPGGKPHIAKGKENSEEQYRFWEVSDPAALTEIIRKKFEGASRHQFRRIVRYFKRWKDVKFASEGHAAPLGIGLTVAAYEYLQPVFFDPTSGKPDDLEALTRLVQALLNQFYWEMDNDKPRRRLKLKLPIEPGKDLFEQMTYNQMEAFEDKLKKLLEVLNEVAKEIDPVEACTALHRQFGDDFPVPQKEETAKRHAPAIVSSSNSA